MVARPLRDWYVALVLFVFGIAGAGIFAFFVYTEALTISLSAEENRIMVPAVFTEEHEAKLIQTVQTFENRAKRRAQLMSVPFSAVDPSR